MNRKELLKKIQELAFAKAETELFLDTHPDDKAALETFYRYREELRMVMEEYEGKYGPLTADGVSGERFTFCDMPWPWHTDDGKDGR